MEYECFDLFQSLAIEKMALFSSFSMLMMLTDRRSG